ncbi:MAG: hypothetical protein HOP13_13985 [Alphaproteobacteria bacterium]|nr:hypothetical protein [Alphaproteobacteria bacterium]
MRYVWRAIVGLLLLSGVVIIAAAVWFVVESSFWKDVPEEKWVCIDQFGYGHGAKYEPKRDGTHVIVEAETQVELFALSCVEERGTNCFDNDGWGSAKIDVWGGPKPFAVFFDHESSGIKDRYRHHVRLVGDFATSLIAAFRAGTSADITTYGHEDEVMKVTKINLDGFNAALDQCIAVWATERQKK